MKLTTFAVVDHDKQIILTHEYHDVEHPGMVQPPDDCVHFQIYDGWLGPYWSADIAAYLIDLWHPMAPQDRAMQVPVIKPLVDWDRLAGAL